MKYLPRNYKFESGLRLINTGLNKNDRGKPIFFFVFLKTSHLHYIFNIRFPMITKKNLK
jgi:hypothetical protein